MELREAQADDAEFISDLINAPHVRNFVTPQTAAQVEASITDADECYLVAEHAGQAVGVAMLAGLQNPHDCVELRKVAVGEPGQGYGRQLTKLVIQRVFADVGAHRLWLDVYPENATARSLYKTLGFVEEGTQRESIKTDNAYRSLVIMSILSSDFSANRSAPC